MTERTVPFGGLQIRYDDEVLEPREWTVEQGRWAATLLEELPAGPVLELCSGAGQIGLVAVAGNGRALVQVDTDETACRYARANAEAAGLPVDVRCGRMEKAVAEGERFPLVLADPPYIRAEDVGDLPDDPQDAIDGGHDGLDLARTCLTVAADHLATGGRVLLQLGGPAQTEAVTHEAPSYGLELVEARTYGADRSLVLLRLSD